MAKDRKTFAIFAITKHGIEIAQRLQASLPDSDLFVSKRLFGSAPKGALKLSLPMGPAMAEAFPAYDCQVFIISVGAVVRMIAPLLKNKKVDPAVVCVDDAANFSICVLSGHVGRGNQFTSRIAEVLDALPVITTASDAKGTLTVDILGRDLGWVLDDSDHNVTSACAAVVNEDKVIVVQECGEPDWWPLGKALPPGVSYATSLEDINAEDYAMMLIASDRDITAMDWDNAVVFRPKSLILGLGCDRDTPFELVERGIHTLLKEAGLSVKSVGGFASIDKKQDELAFTELSQKYNWPFIVYPAEELDPVEGVENPSDVVKKHVGSRTVAEGACLLRAGASRLLVPKQRYSEEGIKYNMTLAVARIPHPARSQGDST